MASAQDDAPKLLPFRNSILSFDQSLSAGTFSRSAQQTYDPYYAWLVTFRPRYYLADAVFVGLTQGVQLELTDASGPHRLRESRTKNRQALLTDTWLDLTYAQLSSWDLGAGRFSLSPGLRLVLPASLASRAQQLYFGVGPTLASRLPIADVMQGLLLGANARYQHNFHGSNVPLRESPEELSCAVQEPTRTRCFTTGGFSSASDLFLFTLFSSLSPLPDMTVDVSFTWFWLFGRGLSPAVVAVDSAPSGFVELEDASRTHLRLLTFFSIGTSYNLTPYLNVALTLGTLGSEFDASGARRNPFFNVYDTTVDLTATIVLDRFYTTFFGAEGAGETPVNPRNQVRNRASRLATF